MIITATELKTNIGKYLKLAETQDIIITKNNKPIVKLTSLREDALKEYYISIKLHTPA